jgi:MFS family permease
MDAGTHRPMWAAVRQVFGYRNTWLICAVNSGTCGAFLAFTGLWGVPFLAQHHALTVKQASLVTSAMLVLFALSGPLFGALSDRWHLRRRPYAIGAGMMLAGFALMAMWPAAPLPLLVPALLVAAIGAASMVISFGYAKESVPVELQGTVTGVVNAGVMLGTLTQMPVIGLILDAYWQGEVAGGVRQYSLQAFQVALQVLAGWVAVAFALLLATRETHAKQALAADDAEHAVA